MVLDWLAREGWIVFSWWALVTLAGLAALPLVVRLLSALPDRGYTLARAVGLLLVGFTFWLLASLGLVPNAPGSVLLAWLIVLAAALVVYFLGGPPFDWRAWWRANKPVVVAGELIFAGLLLGWALYRAHQNSLIGTEKPMELMFISSIMRSPTFPPNDGWLAGYAISYYYFGYVMAAALSMLSGINSSTGFNLTISLLFALTGLNAFGVVYNLVRSRSGQSFRPALLTGLLGLVLVVFLSNFQPVFVEIPYQAQAVSEDYLRFWDTKNRDAYEPSARPINLFNPNEARLINWWWFNAARTLTERDLNGARVNEVIDEFPQFSFLLADVHPHVLALPFAVMALGLALNALLSGRPPLRSEIVLYALCLGGLVFLNVWDGPIYMAVLVGAEALRRLHNQGQLARADWWALLRLGVSLAALSVAFYLPFYIGFQSQAAGLLPNLLHPTRFQQYFLMFGPLLLLLLPFLIDEARRGGRRVNWPRGAAAAAGVLAVLLALMLALTVVGAIVPETRAVALGFVDQNGGWERVLPALIARRAETILTTGALLVGIAVVVARLFARRTAADEPGEPYSPAAGFALLLIGVGLTLSLIPEFVYLRDNFGTRMNTIFKFYYQAWVVFSVAAAYGMYSLLTDQREGQPVSALARAGVTALLVVVLALGLIYPVLGIFHRALLETGRLDAETPSPLTLDGGRTLVGQADYEAVACLGRIVGTNTAVVAEAVGNSYEWQHGRVATLAGIPVVMNWPGHQSQWRGPTYSAVTGTRVQDIERLYTDLRWDVAQGIIERYNIDYVFFGSTERARYGAAGEDKFRENLETICDFGTSRVYRVSRGERTARR